MNDVERLFRQLVEVLSSGGPGRVETPFQVSELYQSLVPHRKQLGFDTNQDYEMAVLRLLAGEGGYASVEPAEIQEQLIEEARSINPNPGTFREFAAARVSLSRVAVRAVQSIEATYAPPAPEPEVPPQPWARYAPGREEPAPQEDRSPAPEALESSRAAPEPEPTPESREEVAPPAMEVDLCPHCTDELPKGRQAVFCPFCGERVGSARCSRCGSEIETGWRFCISCGRRATEA